MGSPQTRTEGTDEAEAGLLIIRFGETRPDARGIDPAVLRDFQEYCTSLVSARPGIASWQVAHFLTEPGGQIALAGDLQSLLDLALDPAYRVWLLRLRVVFADVSAVVAQGGSNGIVSGLLDDLTRVYADMDRYATSERRS